MLFVDSYLRDNIVPKQVIQKIKPNTDPTIENTSPVTDAPFEVLVLIFDAL